MFQAMSPPQEDSPGCSEKPPPEADLRGLGTENGTGADPPEAEREEDALLNSGSKNRSKSRVFIVNY